MQFELEHELSSRDAGYAQLVWSSDSSTLALVRVQGVELAKVKADAPTEPSEPPTLAHVPGSRALAPGLRPSTFLMADEAGLGVLEADGQVRQRFGPFQALRAGRLVVSPSGRWVLVTPRFIPVAYRTQDDAKVVSGSLLIDREHPEALTECRVLLGGRVTGSSWRPDESSCLLAWVGGQHGEIGGLSVLDTQGSVTKEVGWKELEGNPISLHSSQDGGLLICAIQPYQPDRAKFSPRLVRLHPTSLEVLAERKFAGLVPAPVLLDKNTLLIVPPRGQGAWELWDPATLEKTATLRDHPRGVPVFSPDGLRAAIKIENRVLIYRITRN